MSPFQLNDDDDDDMDLLFSNSHNNIESRSNGSGGGGGGGDDAALLGQHKSVDAVLATELNRMDLQRREVLYEEIHGVDTLQDETTKFLQEKYIGFDYSLHSIQVKPAYDLASKIAPGYVTDPKFRLMFLRASAYDTDNAAIRCVKFLEEKHRLFGPGPLARRLFLSDLSDDDMVCLRSGALQVLPQRDTRGRAVVGNFRTLIPRSYKVVDNMVRALFYFMCAVAEDEETQKRGCVTITYIVDHLVGDYNKELMKKVSQCSEYNPIRQKGVHICFNNPLLRTLQPFLLKVMGKDVASRLRLHYGTHTECQYSMMTFGIPVQHLPVTQDGVLKISNNQKWIKRREIMDNVLKRGSPFEAVDLPRKNDVLLGRGKPFQFNPGNVFMRNLVESKLETYQSAPLGQKNVMAANVVKTIQNVPARFVKKRDDGYWVEVDDSEALMKVLKTFRTVRSLQNEESKTLKQGKTKRAKTLQLHPGSGGGTTTASCFGISCGGETGKPVFLDDG